MGGPRLPKNAAQECQGPWPWDLPGSELFLGPLLMQLGLELESLIAPPPLLPAALCSYVVKCLMPDMEVFHGAPGTSYRWERRQGSLTGVETTRPPPQTRKDYTLDALSVCHPASPPGPPPTPHPLPLLPAAASSSPTTTTAR